MRRATIIKEIEKKMKEQEVIDKLSRTFNILGDPTRARIIFALSKAELCVAELSSIINVSHSAISHQMRPLRDLDLVECRKDGKKAYYSLRDEHIENLFEEGLRHVLEKL